MDGREERAPPVTEDDAPHGLPRPLTRREAALDVLLAVLLIPASAVAAGLIASWLGAGSANLAAVVLLQALLSLAGLAALLAWRGQSFAAIGLKPPVRRDLPRALIVVLTAFAANALLTLVIYAFAPQVLEEHIAGLQAIAGGLTGETPLSLALALLLLVGFYEELVARGLVLARSRMLVGGFWFPVLFSSALFGLGHFYQGTYGTVQTALLGVVLAAYTIRWGTLWPAIIAHAGINMLSVLQLENMAVIPR